MSSGLHFLVYLAEAGATQQHPGGHAATAALLARLDLRPGQRVLEIGCGAGETLVQIAARYPVRLDGVDALPPMIRVARRRLRLTGLARRVHVYRARPDGRLPFPDRSYDRVYTESVLGFQEAPVVRALRAEIHRVLRPAGLFLANEAIWKADVPAATVAAINESCRADFGLSQASPEPWALADWRRLGEEAGFTILATDLLDTLDGSTAASAPPDGRLRLALSQGLTLFYRLRGRATPRLRRQRAQYHAALRRHATDGQYIEGRLFVFQKPAGGP